MTAQPQVLKIRRPDDWHIHLRDDEMLKTVVPYTSRIWPGDRDAEPVPRNDRGRRARLPRSHSGGGPAGPQLHSADDLLPDQLPAASELVNGFEQGVFTAAKLYPANATTNSSHGVSDVTGIYPLFEQMQKSACRC